MASTVIAYLKTVPREGSALSRTGRWRYFFAGLAGCYALVALVGFLPRYFQFQAGSLELSWAAHAHGVLMASWLVLLVTQAMLPAVGRVDLHRRLGTATACFAVVIWLSMIAVGLRQIGVAAPPQGHFLYNILLLQAQAVLLFPIFFWWAVAARRRAGWHKRLMVLTMIVPLGAAVDRMSWLPVGGIDSQWPWFLYLDILLIPLVIFDLVSLRKVHPATLVGAGILVTSQMIVTAMWDTASWHHLAYLMTAGLR